MVICRDVFWYSEEKLLREMKIEVVVLILTPSLLIFNTLDKEVECACYQLSVKVCVEPSPWVFLLYLSLAVDLTMVRTARAPVSVIAPVGRPTQHPLKTATYTNTNDKIC